MLTSHACYYIAKSALDMQVKFGIHRNEVLGHTKMKYWEDGTSEMVLDDHPAEKQGFSLAETPSWHLWPITIIICIISEVEHRVLSLVWE